ncbi:hypothetical protein [Haloferula sargassicola]|uniref:Uncharacterized protein n=1 Tax=Haloferula sargassicola TaxID=490096 RepID=A0ABP9UKF1_9BACT
MNLDLLIPLIGTAVGFGLGCAACLSARCRSAFRRGILEGRRRSIEEHEAIARALKLPSDPDCPPMPEGLRRDLQSRFGPTKHQEPVARELEHAAPNPFFGDFH